MNDPRLNPHLKAQLIERFRAQPVVAKSPLAAEAQPPAVSDAYTRFDRHPLYERLLVQQTTMQLLNVPNPFFKPHDGLAAATTTMGGREFINFSSYNYLGLNGHPEVSRAAQQAIDRYGTTPSASRLVAGERAVQRELEQALADWYGTQDAVVFVSGHATNVSTIGTLLGPRDLILHDAFIHNSVFEGIRLSGAARRSFPHNDLAALSLLLAELRSQFERVLIVVEGLYSMDGDSPDLPELVRIKQQFGAWLMVDEAHSLGVLGATGRGLMEHCGVAPSLVDIWMGTLSKTLASCGGYIAGNQALIDMLKYHAPGFVYSVGLAPPLAAASLQALHILRREPERVGLLTERSRQLLHGLANMGIDTGSATGHAVVPAILGQSLKSVRWSQGLFEAGINVQPIIHPAVEEKAARLRFFVSSTHTPAQVDTTLAAIGRLAA
jgi:8-amino-7-oxononanoate synthase